MSDEKDASAEAGQENASHADASQQGGCAQASGDPSKISWPWASISSNRLPAVYCPETPGLDPGEWLVERDDGVVQCSRDGRTILVEGGEAFHRNGVTFMHSPIGTKQEHRRMLVVRLNGVSLYVHPDGSIVVSERDLYF